MAKTAARARDRGFVYRPRSYDETKERADRKGSAQFDSIFKPNFDTWTPKVGDNVVRILPPTWDRWDHYGYEVWGHFWVGPNNGSYLCPLKMKNKPCAICAAAKEAKSAGEDEEEVKKLQPTQKTIIWIIDREDQDANPQLWTVSWTQDRDIVDLTIERKKGKVLVVDHPDEGYDLSFNRRGQGLKTKYGGWAFDRDPSPIHDDQREQDRILDFIQDNPLPTVLRYYDNEYLEAMLSGTATEKDKDLDETEAEQEDRPTRDRTRDTRRAREEETDADGQEEEEEPESHGRRDEGRRRRADEDERPRSRLGRASRAVEEEDEEGGEPPRRRTARDSGEEEESPRRGRTGRVQSQRDRGAEPDPEEEEEEEAEERYTRQRGSRARDQEDDDIPSRRRREEEEEEEDEAPRRRVSSRSNASRESRRVGSGRTQHRD
jgi:hypothetical protein